jgi:predicted PurR-regulated permease PerM
MVDKTNSHLTTDSAKWSRRRDIPLTILGWVAVIMVSFWVISHIAHSIIMLIIGALFAYALVPAVRFLDKYIPRFLALILVYVGVLFFLGIVTYSITATAIEQFVSLSNYVAILLGPKGSQTIAPYMETLKHIGITSNQMEQIRQQLTVQVEHISNSIIPFLSSFFSSLFDLLLVAVISIYLLIDGEKLKVWLKKNVPNENQGDLHFVLNTFERVVGGYIRGQIILALIIGVLVTIGMLIFHVPYAILLGVIAFIFEFIPIIGVFISGAICVLLAFTQGWVVALLVLIYFIVIHVIEGDILGPRIVGKALGLHPLISILALVAGSELFGMIGALLAAPVAGLAQALIAALWAEWRANHPHLYIRKKR